MPEFNLLRALPNTKRNIQKRSDAKNASVVAIAKQFGDKYFDGPREYGYGGYRYDGRWRPVARDIIARFGLKPGMRVLDVGCAKGFLVKDLMLECPGLDPLHGCWRISGTRSARRGPRAPPETRAPTRKPAGGRPRS